MGVWEDDKLGPVDEVECLEGEERVTVFDVRCD